MELEIDCPPLLVPVYAPDVGKDRLQSDFQCLQVYIFRHDRRAVASSGGCGRIERPRYWRRHPHSRTIAVAKVVKTRLDLSPRRRTLQHDRRFQSLCCLNRSGGCYSSSSRWSCRTSRDPPPAPRFGLGRCDDAQSRWVELVANPPQRPAN